MDDTATVERDGRRGWPRLVAAVADRVVVTVVEDVHRAVTDGAFRWVGPVGRPAKAVHDRVVGGVYTAVRMSLRAAGEVVAAQVGARPPPPGLPSAAARKAQAIAHGVVDAELLALAPELDLEMTVRVDGRAVTPDRATFRRVYPAPSDHLVVFVHGLVDTEDVWSPRLSPRRGEGVSLPDIAVRHGASPLLVRYGTGRAIGRNGLDLAEVLDATVAAWPRPVTRLTLVGHSMGGLVARAALAEAARRGHGWTAPLTDVVGLGTPHLGSWLEKTANVATWTLRRASTRSAPIGALVDRRSRGIKDLRHGTLDEHGWSADTIDDLLTGRLPDEPWTAGVTHHLVVGRLRPSERHPLNLALGDALVRAGSAAGTGRRRRIGAGGPVEVHAVPVAHTDLATHPRVGEVLDAVLRRDPAGR